MLKIKDLIPHKKCGCHGGMRDGNWFAFHYHSCLLYLEIEIHSQSCFDRPMIDQIFGFELFF